MPTTGASPTRRVLCGLGLALGLLAGCATGGKPAPTPVPAPAAAPAPAPAAPVAWGRDGDLAVGPFLWQVEGRNGATLFLFGTIHTEPGAAVPPAAWERVRTSRTLALEADVTALGVQAVMAKALLPPGESLSTLVGPEAWARLRDFLKDSLPETALARLRPWFVVTLVVLKATGAKPGVDPMDLALMKAGRDAGMTLRFLETAEEQIDLLARTFDASVLAALAAHLDALPGVIQ